MRKYENTARKENIQTEQQQKKKKSKKLAKRTTNRLKDLGVQYVRAAVLWRRKQLSRRLKYERAGALMMSAVARFQATRIGIRKWFKTVCVEALIRQSIVTVASTRERYNKTFLNVRKAAYKFTTKNQINRNCYIPLIPVVWNLPLAVSDAGDRKLEKQCSGTSAGLLERFYTGNRIRRSKR